MRIEPRKSKKKSTFIGFVLIFVLLLVSVGGIYLYQSQRNQDETQIFRLGEFLVQLEDGNYIKYSMTISYTGDVKKELNAKRSILRDKVIAQLTQSDKEDFNAKNLEHTRKLIVNELKPLVKKGQVENLYFENLIVQ